MRYSLLLAALLSVSALSGCADQFATDGPEGATVAAAAAPAAAALHCARLTGPDALDPDASATYRLDATDCGTLTALDFSIEGDGSIVAVPWFGKEAPEGEPVTVRAHDVPSGSFVLTADFSYRTSFGAIKSSSLSRTVTVGTPPPPPTSPMNVTVTGVSNGVSVNWTDVPAATDRLELTIEHSRRGEGMIDTRTVVVTGQSSYFDTLHVTSTNGMELVGYRLVAYQGTTQLAQSAAGIYGTHKAVDW